MLASLPHELLESVAGFLTVKDAVALSTTSKTFQELKPCIVDKVYHEVIDAATPIIDGFIASWQASPPKQTWDWRLLSTEIVSLPCGMDLQLQLGVGEKHVDIKVVAWKAAHKYATMSFVGLFRWFPSTNEPVDHMRGKCGSMKLSSPILEPAVCNAFDDIFLRAAQKVYPRTCNKRKR